MDIGNIQFSSTTGSKQDAIADALEDLISRGYRVIATTDPTLVASVQAGVEPGLAGDAERHV